MKRILTFALAFLLLLSFAAATTDILRIGENTTKDGEVFTVTNIGEDSIVISKNYTKKIVEEEESVRWSGFVFYVEDIHYAASSEEESYVILSICTDEKETCNNIDDDCDGKIDDVERDCGIEIGACKKGTQKCISGEWGSCENQVISSTEICNGVDDDCDGEVDEDIADRECGLDTGECKKGTQVCEDGEWSECTDSVERKLELCNKKDDDCDGQVDEGACEKDEAEEEKEESDEEEGSAWSRFVNWLKSIF